MNSDRDLVRYACVAYNPNQNGSDSTTILAEFNSADSSLQELAHQCVKKAPPHHSIFSHSYRNQTYTFMIDDPFVYFGMFDPNMPKHDQVRFLGRLQEALHHLIKGSSYNKYTSYCFQGELHPIFHKLMSKSFDFDALNLFPNGVHNNNVSTPSTPPVSGSSKGGRKVLSVPLLSSSKVAAKGYKKKRFGGGGGDSMTESKEALVENKVDMLEDDGVSEVKTREINCHNGVCLIDSGAGGRQKARKIWRRHVWIVLVLDLAVCLILFGIWLFVCKGFQCIEG